MSEEIIKVLDNLAQKFGIAIDWTNQNIIPYLQELITRFIGFKNAQAIMWISIGFIAIIVSIATIVFIKKWVKKNDLDSYDDEYGVAILGYALAGTAIIAFVIVLFCNIQGFIQNTYVPELTVLEEIKNIQEPL